MRIMKFALIAALPIMLATGANANEFEPQLRDLAKNNIQAWLSSPSVIDAVKAQNTAHSDLTETKIVALDKQWRAETNASSRPMINACLSG